MPFWRVYRLGSWEFFLDEREGNLVLRVPDRGGQMDMLPRAPEQLAWAEAHVPDGLSMATRVWATTWELPLGALPDVEAFFRRHGATAWPEAPGQAPAL